MVVAIPVGGLVALGRANRAPQAKCAHTGAGHHRGNPDMRQGKLLRWSGNRRYCVSWTSPERTANRTRPATS